MILTICATGVHRLMRGLLALHGGGSGFLGTCKSVARII